MFQNVPREPKNATKASENHVELKYTVCHVVRYEIYYKAPQLRSLVELNEI